ncbi:hypothetical protein A1O1_07955 [Capronia coronata CBS 617.96]|uniref:Uncharacterized protein n=1 Tax=Capronia coronata CBS 617.96 TaxID=1182541 RepID=W9XX26_9EURO|nr:uncharacterized protein A1O1_07955 [Capronia coronata CBS 617.96]EXJ81890.1 hypothetical protein A1O1_07955 [Capronia coronata CBS 617.96]
MFRLKNAISTLGVVGNVHPADGDDNLNYEAEDEVPPLTTTMTAQPDTSTIHNISSNIPPWIRELNNSHTTRHSRASSIVSTRTKFSTTTLQDDARSIDISVGGQYFRISRDGSRITADPPPPYTGPNEQLLFPTNSIGTAILESPYNSGFESADDDRSLDADTDDDGARTPRSTFGVLDTGLLEDTLRGLQLDLPLSTRTSQLKNRSSSVTVSDFLRLVNDDEGEPARKDHSDADSGEVRAGPKHINHGPGNSIDGGEGSIAASSLPTIRVDSTTLSGPSIWTDNSSRVNSQTHNEREPAAALANVPITNSADGLLLREPDSSGARPRNPPPEGGTDGSVSSPGRAAVLNGEPDFQGNGSLEGDEHDTPLSMDDENDISLHYARMMRKLDYRHRKALHLKDKELAEMREKLHEKDIVLRQQLRAKDFMIDDLKKRLVNLEECLETMLEKARNQVEDLWEARWKERNAQLLDRIKRVEEDAQTTIENIRAEASAPQEESNLEVVMEKSCSFGRGRIKQTATM